MGDVIYLDERRAARAAPMLTERPRFYFDPGCPFSYLTVERVERTLGDVDWLPVAAASLRDPDRDDHPDVLRERAEARARALRLPLVWPDRFPLDAPFARRAAAHAAELGGAGRFALAASRLAFCGGFDLEDPEILAEAAAAAGVPLDACLAAAGDVRRDEELRAHTQLLRAHGVSELPAINLGGRWFEGEAGLLAACACLRAQAADARPVAPVG